MDRVVAHGWRLCAAAVLVALAGCSSGVRKGMLDGYDHDEGYASACGAAFIGYHGRIERCADQ